eukprot:SAG31_NODE_1071_length_10069_cov_3.085356_8_plen_170_part_00
MQCISFLFACLCLCVHVSVHFIQLLARSLRAPLPFARPWPSMFVRSLRVARTRSCRSFRSGACYAPLRSAYRSYWRIAQSCCSPAYSGPQRTPRCTIHLHASSAISSPIAVAVTVTVAVHLLLLCHGVHGHHALGERGAAPGAQLCRDQRGEHGGPLAARKPLLRILWA